MRRKARTIEPLYQGDLDGLCGLYAIINAIRRIIPKRRVTQISEELFEYLLSYAVKEQGNLMIASEGIGLRDIRQLLLEAIECLIEEHNIHLSMTQPWRLQSSRKPSIDDLISMNTEPNTSVLVGFEAPSKHWSVIDTVTRSRIRLFDSDGHSDIRIDSLLLSRTTSSLFDDCAIIPPNSIFVLTNNNRRAI